MFTEAHKVRPKFPDGAKAVWAECLNHAVKHVAFFNDEKAWVQLFALPKMVLGAPSTRAAPVRKWRPPRVKSPKDVGNGSIGGRAALWPHAPKPGKATWAFHAVPGGAGYESQGLRGGRYAR